MDEINVVVIDPTDPECLEQLADVLAGVVKQGILQALQRAVDHGAGVEELAQFTAEFAEKASTGWEMLRH